MSDRRFEWIESLDEAPGGWTLLDVRGPWVHSTEQAPGWFIKEFHTWSGHQFLNCYFSHWCAKQPDVAVYETENVHPDFGVGFPVGLAYVREVASPLVLACTQQDRENQGAEVTFTTLAGSEVLRVHCSTDLPANMWNLSRLAATAAVTQERLQSPNQAVCIHFGGNCKPLPISTVRDPAWDQWKSENAIHR